MTARRLTAKQAKAADKALNAFYNAVTRAGYNLTWITSPPRKDGKEQHNEMAD